MSDLLTEFHQALQDEIAHEAQGMADGGASSFEDYRYRVGMRKGLQRAVRILEDTVEDYRKRDEKF
jgi:hypothetical protein